MSKRHDGDTMPAAADWAEVFAQKLKRSGIVSPEKGRPSINRRAAFHVYRTMGPNRSLTAVARALEGPGWEGHASMAQLRAWSEAEDWPRACAAWDTEQAEAVQFDELTALEKLSGKAGVLLHQMLEGEDVCVIDTDATSALMDTMFLMGDRIRTVRQNRAGAGLETNTEQRDLLVSIDSTPGALSASGSRDDRRTHQPAEVPWSVSDDLSDSDGKTKCQPYEAPRRTCGYDQDLGDVWQGTDAEEESEGEGTPEETLADFVGSYLDELPEEYRDVLSPSDGQALCVYVGQYVGYVQFHIFTDKRKWVNYLTDIPVK